MEVSREQNEWMELIKEKQKGGKKEERKEGRKKGCQYISGPGYT